MHRRTRRLAASLTAACALALPAVASADPALPGEIGHEHADAAAPRLPAAPDGAMNMQTLAQNNEGVLATTNSDLAFWKDLSVAGNYDGFRLFDISKPASPELLSNFKCRGPQNDVSLYKVRGRMLLFQSIDRAQTSSDCSSKDTPLVYDSDGAPVAPAPTPRRVGDPARASFGFEGIRMFDVTNPREPQFMKAFPTDCGSHTHTLVPDKAGKRLFLYVSSYPLGSGITAKPQAQGNEDACTTPHKKISIVEIPFKDPASGTVREKALSSDTVVARGFQACHDIQAILDRDVAIGSCAGDVQVWDISDRGNPSSADGETHTHVPDRMDGSGRGFDFVHTAIATYDGKLMAVTDETGGGGTAECDGTATDDGFLYFYTLPKPGELASYKGRYVIPRPQGAQICVTHNGQMIPVTDGRYLASVAYYQGGTTVVDFSDPAKPREIAYTDSANSDTWSAYWYNGFIFANGGLDRRPPNPGFEVYSVTDEDGQPFKTGRFNHLNPQTQDGFKGGGGGRR